MPSFILSNVPASFAIDNLDFLEDTLFGNSTLHATLTIINQRIVEGVAKLNEPLVLPKVAKAIQTKPHLTELSTRLTQKRFAYKITMPPSGLQEASAIGDMDWVKHSLSDKLPLVWAAFHSEKLRESQSTQQIRSMIVKTGIMAPLIKSPPTDYSTLYSALLNTQAVSCKIVGPGKTIIVLDMALYERAIKLQKSKVAGSDGWILRPGDLHTCFSSLHGLGKFIGDSGLDVVAVEAGIYSDVALRSILSGKSYKPSGPLNFI